MKILVLSDTHIPRVAQDLPKCVYDAIKGVDMILHAGDFVEKELFDKLNEMKKTRAVYGNMDGADLRHVLNPKEIVEAGRFKIGLIHGYGAPSEIIETVKGEFENVDIVVFGHSHSPVNIEKGGILFFNPGSPTDTVFSSVNSYGILNITDSKIEGKIIKI